MGNTHAVRRAGQPSTKGKTRTLNLGARSDRLASQSELAPQPIISAFTPRRPPLTASITGQSLKTHAFKLTNNKYVAC